MKSAPRPTPRERLHDAGLRATPARIAVLELLAAAEGLLTHVEIADQLVATHIDKSTVFRVLQDLVDAELVRRLDAGDHSWRYEDTARATRSKDEHTHPHLLCVSCGTVTCLTDSEVKLKVPTSVGTVEEIVLKGHCAPCRDGRDSST